MRSTEQLRIKDTTKRRGTKIWSKILLLPTIYITTVNTEFTATSTLQDKSTPTYLYQVFLEQERIGFNPFVA